MRNKYTKELIQEAVNQSSTWADVCRLLGITPATGAQCHLQKRAKDFEIDSSHFLGRGHAKGKVLVKKNVLQHCFTGSKITSHSLRIRLIRDGHKEEKCELCEISEWRGEKVVLELDHKDSNHFNNEISNLQILCPNCHALETKRRRNGLVA